MSHKTRVFVLTASAILVAGLGTAGVASYMQIGRPFSASPSDELTFLPDTAEMVAFVDVQRVLQSELGRRFQAELAANAHTASGPLADAGIDFTRDVDSVLVAGLSSTSSPAPLVFARGRFDYPRIESLFTERGGEVTHYQGIRMASVEPLAIAFLDFTLVVVGRPADVRAALDTRAGQGASLSANADFLRQARLVDDDDTWAVARFDALRRRAQVPVTIAEQLPAISWFAAGGRVDAGIAAHFHAEARDEQAAQDLRQVMQGLVSLMRLQAGQRPELAGLLDTIQLGGEGTSISLGFSVSPEMLEALDKLRQQQLTPPQPAAPSSAPRRPNQLPGILAYLNVLDHILLDAA